MVAINQWTLLRLVEALGQVGGLDEGRPITSDNLLSILEQGTDEYGRAYMETVLSAVLERMNQTMSISELIRLASRIHDSLEERDLLLFFNDPVLQSTIARFGWDGSITQDTMDYLYIVDANVGWSKVDRNIQRGAYYAVDMSEGSRPRATLTVGYTNRSGPGSLECEPQWLNRGDDYSQQKNACYWNFFRIFAFCNFPGIVMSSMFSISKPIAL